ncbi:MAG: Gfo/Idh/MocA family oxidoreductase [Spirochaetales bacterium]|jgi:predicted dehydrogenase|nr:Gfo/Idh/MocA family oxidoreductase [Spirochaetales bacterium]
MQNLKIAIIGCGPRASRHVSVYANIDNTQIVACSDVVEQSARDFAEAYGCKAYTDPEEMITSEKPDIVHIVTPSFSHAEMIELVCRLNVPACQCEKPLCVGVKDYNRIKKAVANTTTKIIVNHQFRYHRDLIRCAEAVASGKLGKIRYCEFSCGMSMNQQGTHILDYVTKLMGDPQIVSVYGTAGPPDPEEPRHPAPRGTVAQVKFDNGVYGTWVTGESAPIVADDGTSFKHCREAVYCEKGWVTYEEFGEWRIVSPDGEERGVIEFTSGGGDAEIQMSESITEWDIENDAAQEKLTRSLIDWLLDDNAISPSNIEHALIEWNAVLALYHSSLTGEIVQIPFDPPEDLFEKMDLMKYVDPNYKEYVEKNVL